MGLVQSQLVSALTIGVRYSAVRCQFGERKGAPEQPVLSYQLQQYRLMPVLAAYYAHEFFYHSLVEQYLEVERVGASGSGSDGTSFAVAEMHALSSGAKAVVSWTARDAIQVCRECCGGHGYSSCVRLGYLRADHEPNLTYEGDNSVLMQQTARWLLAQLQLTLTGDTSRPLSPSAVFLQHWASDAERVSSVSMVRVSE